MYGLFCKGAFTIVCCEELSTNANLLGCRFVLTIKKKETQTYLYKARFVLQVHTNSERNLLINKNTHLKQKSIRLLLAVAAIFVFRLCSQEVIQAYL